MSRGHDGTGVESVVYDQQIGDTRYPGATRIHRLKDSPSQSKLEAERTKFCTSLEDALWKQTGFERVRTAASHDHDGLIRAGTEGLKVLQQAASDVITLVNCLFDVNTEFHTQDQHDELHREEVLQQLKDKLHDRISDDLTPKTAIWAHKLDDILPEVATVEVARRLRKHVRNFVQALVSLFDAMVATEMVGLIRWHPPANCDVLFYREIILRQDVDTVTIRTSKGSEVIHANSLRTIRRARFEVREIMTASYENVNALYSMKLRKAEATRLDDSSTLIPRPIQPLVDAVPGWLRPFVQVVDGERYDLQIIPKRRDNLQVERETTREQIEDQVIYHDPLPYWDPAIVINRYVLTGWGPEEADAEQQRRRAQQAEQEATADANEAAVASWGVAAVSAVVIALSVGLTAMARHVQLLWILGPTVGMVGAIGFVWHLWLNRRAQRKDVPLEYLACGTVTAIMTIFAFHFTVAGVVVQSWLFALAGLGCFVIALLVGVQLRNMAA